MEKILYPPSIEGTLPAFTSTTMAIPFVMNKTVSWNQVSGFAVKIKNISNNELIENLQTTSFSKDKKIAYFTIDSNKIKKGKFYKLQLAYISNLGQIGYFSTVGTIKCTEEPEVLISHLTPAQLHTDLRTYIGTYSQVQRDVTEKVYSYNFKVYDENNQLIETSGEQLHNHENDETIHSSTDTFTLTKSLESNKIYTITYTVTTANGLVKSSPNYRITEQSTIPPEIDAQLIAAMNEENGYVELRLIGEKDTFGVEKVSTGTFLISRSSSEDNYGSWSEVSRFALFGEAPSSHSWRDFTVQHGFTYRYSLQQYNNDYQIYSNRMLSNEIIANFEHSFLYNGKRQLKIKYNPKVSSFKDTLLESKINTLGGKYPFFFRNGNVKYKEFPISGLISYHMDEEELFLTNEDLLLEESVNNLHREHTLKNGVSGKDYEYFNNMLDANVAYQLQNEYLKRDQQNSQENQIARKKDRTSNLTDYNMVAERIFKMQVLDFLNDGKPKLFRSPGEGNFIVRLMNSSLTPNDQLGRMLHTFSTTATEIDDCTYQKLNKYKIIQASEPEIKQLRWKTVNIRELINNQLTNEEYISIGGENNIMSVQFTDMVPGDYIQIEFGAPGNEVHNFQIGVTGAYYVEFSKAPLRVSVSKTCNQGQVTFSYYGTSLHHFDTYRQILMSDVPIIQIDGKVTEDILNKFENVKYKITEYYFLNFSKKVNLEPKPNSITELSNSDNKFWIDDKEFDITLDSNYQLIKPGYIPKITLGDNIRLDISLQRREIVYDIEATDDLVVQAKNAYIVAQNKLLNWIRFNIESTELIVIDINEDDNNGQISNTHDYENTLSRLKGEYQDAEANFLIKLESALKAKEVPLE